MLGALGLGQPLAGAVIALMYSGGNVLEDFATVPVVAGLSYSIMRDLAAGRMGVDAVGRAERDLRALVDRAPRVAHRRLDERVEDVPVAHIVVGDTLLVHAGEVIPVDGIVISPTAIIDESALTGEPLPVGKVRGASAFSRRDPNRQTANGDDHQRLMPARRHDHVKLGHGLDRLRNIADALDDSSPETAVALVDEANTIVQQQVVAHERDDEGKVYPTVARLLTGDRAGLSAMSHAHCEILHLARLLGRVADDAHRQTVDRYLLRDAQRAIESIEVLVRMHVAQEEEIYEAIEAA
jgi:hypothetical protein